MKISKLTIATTFYFLGINGILSTAEGMQTTIKSHNILRHHKRLISQQNPTPIENNEKLERYSKFCIETNESIKNYGEKIKNSRNTPHLYTNLLHNIREVHDDFCTYLRLWQNNIYIGPNLLTKSCEKNLRNRTVILNNFKSIDSTNYKPSDDLKLTLKIALENTLLMFNYIPDAINILDSRITKEFNTNLCIKTLIREIKPTLVEFDSQLGNHVDSLCQHLLLLEMYKQNNSWKKAPHENHFHNKYKEIDSWKELPLNDEMFSEDYADNLSSFLQIIQDQYDSKKLTKEQNSAAEFFRDIYENIDRRHAQEDTKAFIEASYIINKNRE